MKHDRRPNLIQAYKQAPWRKQVQWIGLFLLGLIVISAAAWVYLTISARAAAAGRDVQRMENQSVELEKQIASLQSTLGRLRSREVLRARAEELGFVDIAIGQARYVVMPGYTGRQTPNIAPPPTARTTPATLLLPDYTSSLWDVLMEGLVAPTLNTFGRSNQP